MKIIILEDEPPIADFIKINCYEILGNIIRSINVFYTMGDAVKYLKSNSIDLCLLDLNLSGDDGFDFLKRVVSMPFDTIVISAYSDRAITAYEYGVIDFVPKPFDKARLQLALDRFFGRNPGESKLKYLIYRKNKKYKLLDINQIVFFKSDRIIVEAYTEAPRPVLLDKHLIQLEKILPRNFIRIHKSYIVNSEFIESIGTKNGGNSSLKLTNSVELPVSRTRIKSLKGLFIH